MSASVVEVHITVPDPELAQLIATELVQARLAACVQILGPMLSVFHWRDELQTNREYLLTVKTLDAAFEALSAKVTALHTYDLPEIVALPILRVTPEYAQWVIDEVAATDQDIAAT
ncbi:MAG: divalent-cation tolerance protein CutA [Nostocoides sp.]